MSENYFEWVHRLFRGDDTEHEMMYLTERYMELTNTRLEYLEERVRLLENESE